MCDGYTEYMNKWGVRGREVRVDKAVSSPKDLVGTQKTKSVLGAQPGILQKCR